MLRRSNGYFIYSTVEGVSYQPRSVPTGPFTFCMVRQILHAQLQHQAAPQDWMLRPCVLLQGKHEVIQGLEQVVAGMRVGGKRRAIIPPEAGYVNPDSDAPQLPTFSAMRQVLNHAKEPLLFEIQLLRSRPGDCR